MTVPVAEYATGRVRSSEGSRSRAYRSEQRWFSWETKGHQWPCQSWRLAVKQGFTRGHVVRHASAGRAAVEAPSEAKVEDGVIRESSGSQGARVVMSVAEVG